MCWLPFPITKFKDTVKAFSPTEVSSGKMNLNDLMQSQGGAFNRPQANQNDSGESSDFIHVIKSNITWYLFLAVFFAAALKRRKEVERLPSVFDFARFSLSNGSPHPALYKFKLGKMETDVRIVSTIIEPAICFVIGFILFVLHQLVGNLLMVCSVIYSLSYFAAYHIGDNYIMDKIDEIICNEELKETLVDGREPVNDRGFNFEPRMPENPEYKKKVYESFFEEEESSEAF